MLITELYPEIAQTGNLTAAINNQLSKLGSALRCYSDAPKVLFAHTQLAAHNKYLQVSLAAEEKLYLSDYYQDGVMLAHGATNDLNHLTHSLIGWLSSTISISELVGKYAFVSTTKIAPAFEQGKEVEYAWNRVLHDPIIAELRDFANLAIQDSHLSQLFPFTSLLSLHFSRCSGYPYTFDLPYVVYLSSNVYEVYAANQLRLGRGTAQQALKLLLQHMPPDLKPAVRGTADKIQH